MEATKSTTTTFFLVQISLVPWSKVCQNSNFVQVCLHKARVLGKFDLKKDLHSIKFE